MSVFEPDSAAELAEALREAAAAGRSIALGGGFSKQAMAGPAPPAELTLSTRRLNRVLEYDPRDLTVSVEAGLSFAEFSRLLAGHGQMAPLDPFLSERATVGGVLAANISGPRRRLYGTARDMLIGMRFATLEGKLIESGGMVVKNVAGLDLARLMVGSFGTLAAIVSANFRLAPIPPGWRTFLRACPSLEEALAARDAVLSSVLQPAALDLLNPAAAGRLQREGFLLALEAGGSPAVLERYARELSGWRALDPPEAEAFWRGVREFTPEFLAAWPAGAVVRAASTLTGLKPVLETLQVPAVARAGSGVLWAYFNDCQAAAAWVRQAAGRGWKVVIEFAPPDRKAELPLWPAPGPDFPLMERLKAMFDPRGLLNRGRLYGRI
jgi:glycolate oxidase FAD binding subunit